MACGSRVQTDDDVLKDVIADVNTDVVLKDV